MKWIARFAAPFLLYEIFFRRLPYARYIPPTYKAELHSIAVQLLVKPGDILLCRGDSVDSASVAAWSKSIYSHVAVIGPDLMVYDMTPIENERCMSVPDYVQEYDGMEIGRAHV